jgi:predicted GH43/DUF377 family glycosyl hydrolase
MVLNPAVIEDPDTGRIHMLVRVSGPCPEKRLEGKPMPFPIFFSYAWSDDGGENFEFDFERPALSPTVEYEEEFEAPRKFKTPCVFFTGAIPVGDKLLVSYGAADEFAAVMQLDFQKIISVLRNYPYNR